MGGRGVQVSRNNFNLKGGQESFGVISVTT